MVCLRVYHSISTVGFCDIQFGAFGRIPADANQVLGERPCCRNVDYKASMIRIVDYSLVEIPMTPMSIICNIVK